MPITLAMVQRHINAELVEDDEQAYVMDQLLPAAREAASLFLNRNFYDTPEELAAAISAGTSGDYPLITPRAVDQAILLMLGDFYRDREATGKPVSTSAHNLLYPYRVRVGV
uniref:Head-tail adaptor Ad1 n=1 Tax=Xanthomonas phage MK21 TaxID=3148942 RepID=A0AAU7J8V9_9CAUD